jgi:hypothetical protein
MNTVPTWVKKITFELRHPRYTEHTLVRTLVVSDTIHVPDGYTPPTLAELGFESFDYRDPADLEKIRQLIVKEVIRSKVDGLAPHAVSDVIRETKESTFQILATASDRLANRWHARFGVKLTMPGREQESTWFGGKEHPVYTFTGNEWTGVDEPEFYSTCIYVSKIVAAGAAENAIQRWQDFGLPEQPLKADVQELCYARQTVQLVTEIQRDALAGGVSAFGARTPELLDV